jgi:hypothetical protein
MHLAVTVATKEHALQKLREELACGKLKGAFG